MDANGYLANEPVQDMAALLNIRLFNQQQIEFLTSRYCHGGLTKWGNDEVFQGALGRDPGDEPAIIALAWEMNQCLGHIVCVIDPGSPRACILRIILAPDFLWLGLHFVGTECDGELGMTEETELWR